MSKVSALFNGKKEAPPLWFMRQAGRYLPEYRKIRKTQRTFLDLCYSPDLATEITLQPLRRFDLDVAILFSDILVIPDALGQKVTFIEGKGPQLDPLSLDTFQEKLRQEKLPLTLEPVYETLRKLKPQLSSEKALFGFAGAPWTLALYMLEGEGSRHFEKAKVQAFQNETGFNALLDTLVKAVTEHACNQIAAGADAIQLFDTWAGHCPMTHFDAWILEPTKAIVEGIKARYPETPVIGFPKGVGAQLIPYAERTGIEGVSLDAVTSLPWAHENLPPQLVFQGNLDPLLLVAGGEPLRKAIEELHGYMNSRPYIFNLGHGILPQTPVEHVEACVNWVRELD